MTMPGVPAGGFGDFLTTLEGLPPFRGVTFRGCPADAGFARAGQEVVTRGLVSTSRILDVATERRAVPGLYALMSSTGRDISAFSASRAEHEIVFLPGTQLRVVDRQEMFGLDVRLVVELEPGRSRRPGPEFVARFADEMKRYLAGRAGKSVLPVDSVAGKFCGDIEPRPWTSTLRPGQKPTRPWGTYAFYRGKEYEVHSSAEETVNLTCDLASLEAGAFPDELRRDAGERPRWVTLPRKALDALLSVQVRATWRGQEVTVARIVGQQAGLHFLGSPLFAEENAMDGDQYNGWGAWVSLDELSEVREEIKELFR